MAQESRSLLQRGAGWFEDLLKWIAEGITDEDVRAGLRSDLGLSPEKPDSTVKLEIEDRKANIEAYRKKVNPDFEAFLATLQDLKAVAAAIENGIKSTQQGTDAFTDEMIHQWFRLMTVNYLRFRFPLVYWSGQLFGFIEQQFSTDVIPEPVGKAIIPFLKDPVKELKRLYTTKNGDGERFLDTEEDARVLSHATFIPLLTFWI
jgi:hypothetical protein